MLSNSAFPETPPLVPHYELRKCLGQGAFGSVWLGRHRTGAWQAVKIVRRSHLGDASSYEKELAGLQRFLREIPLGEPRQLAVLPLDTIDGERQFYAELADGTGFYYVMELADDLNLGEVQASTFDPTAYRPKTLKAVLDVARRERRVPLSPRAVVQLGIQLVEAVANLHAHGLIHRDIKPSNVIYIRAWPKLADIGLVTSTDVTRTFAGTGGYFPPDATVTPSVDHDLYAVGKVLYELATGFDRNEYPRELPDADRVPEAGVLRELRNAVIDRACAPRRADRYPGAELMLRELRAIGQGQSPLAQRALERRLRWLRRIAVVASPLAVIASLVAWREMINGRKLAATDRRLAFTLYQRNLEQAAINLERPRFGLARTALNEAAHNGVTNGIEVELLARQAVGDPNVVISADGAAVDRLVWSPDGSRLAVARKDKSADVFTVPAGERLGRWPDVRELAGFLGSNQFYATVSGPSGRPLVGWQIPGGRRLATALTNGWWLPARVLADGVTLATFDADALGQIVFWKPDSGTEPPRQTWRPGSLDYRTAKSLFWSSSSTGQRILLSYAIGSEDIKRSWLHFVDLNEPVPVPMPLEFKEPVSATAIAANGQLAAYAEPTHGSVVVGKYAAGFAAIGTNYLGETRALALSPDAHWLASGGEDERVRVHDTSHPDLFVDHEFQGHGSFITALAWGDDGQWLASGDRRGEVRIWRPQTTATAAETGVWPGFKDSVGPANLIATPDGQLVVVSQGTNTVTLLSGASWQARRDLPGVSVPLALTADHAELWGLTAGAELVRMRLADGAVLARLSVFPGRTNACAGLASADGRWLVAYAGGDVAGWSLSDGRQAWQWVDDASPHGNVINDVAFSDDGTRALTVGRDELVSWNVASGRTNWVMNLTSKGFAAAFLLGGKECVVAGENQSLARFDLLTGRLLGEVPQALTAIYAMVPSRDGRRILAAGANGRLAVLQAPDLTPLVWFKHRGLRRAGDTREHTIKRLLQLPASNTVLGLTEDGLLVRW